MTEPMTVLRARLGANALHAQRSRAEVAGYLVKARAAQRAKLEAAVVEQYGLDRADPDYAHKLEHGIRAHYAAKAMRRAKGKR